ncbi:MAG: hypothetical protein RR671_03520 [Raoultibacter sp.]
MGFPQTKSLSQQQATHIAAVCMVLVALACWFAFDAVETTLREQSAVSVRDTILNGAKQCCAIEGSYPPSLAYLEDNYGLAINRSSYAITYDVFAENVIPSVVVLPK